MRESEKITEYGSEGGCHFPWGCCDVFVYLANMALPKRTGVPKDLIDEPLWSFALQETLHKHTPMGSWNTACGSTASVWPSLLGMMSGLLWTWWVSWPDHRMVLCVGPSQRVLSQFWWNGRHEWVAITQEWQLLAARGLHIKHLCFSRARGFDVLPGLLLHCNQPPPPSVHLWKWLWGRKHRVFLNDSGQQSPAVPIGNYPDISE